MFKPCDDHTLSILVSYHFSHRTIFIWEVFSIMCIHKNICCQTKLGYMYAVV